MFIKMQFLPLILDVTRIANFWSKMLMSVEFSGLWHVVYIYFGSSFVKVMTCATDFKLGGFSLFAFCLNPTGRSAVLEDSTWLRGTL